MNNTDSNFDVVNFLMIVDGGHATSKQLKEGFQHITDSGLVWKLEGRYGRLAAQYIRAGFIKDTHGALKGK